MYKNEVKIKIGPCSDICIPKIFTECGMVWLVANAFLQLSASL